MQGIDESAMILKALQPATASDRLVQVSRKLKDVLDDPKKQKRLEKLLQELEALVALD